MKYQLLVPILATILGLPIWGQDITVTGDAASGLDLQAVGEIFRESKNSEDFERRLNDPRIGVNNLDLDADNHVDYIRVLEEAGQDARVLVMQVSLGEKEYQDVATIHIEKDRDDYEVEIQGNVEVYGPNYYIRPPRVNWVAVGFVGWLFRPNYRVWRSPYYYGYYPRVWRPWRPVTVNVYRTKTVRYSTVNWKVHSSSRVVRTKTIYKPKSSVLVKRELRSPTKAQKEFQVRQKTKTVSSGGFGKTTRTGTAQGSNGSSASLKKTTVEGPNGASVTRSKATAEGPNGGTASRKRTTVEGANGRKLTRTKSNAEGAAGREAKRTKTTAQGRNGSKTTKTKTKTKSKSGNTKTKKVKRKKKN